MTPRKKQRALFLVFSCVSFSLGMTCLLFALKDNLMYFYTPSDLTERASFYHRKIRLGGLVKKGSVRHSQQGLKTFFTVCDEISHLNVGYEGLLPDLFREGQGVIVEGVLKPEGMFYAQKVLAKHDETYMPPEVAKSLHTSHKAQVSKSLEDIRRKGQDAG